MAGLYSGGGTALKPGHRHTALSRFFPKYSRGAKFFQVEKGSGMDNLAQGFGDNIATPLGDLMARYLISPIADWGAEHIGEEYYPTVNWTAIAQSEADEKEDEIWRENQFIQAEAEKKKKEEEEAEHEEWARQKRILTPEPIKKEEANALGGLLGAMLGMGKVGRVASSWDTGEQVSPVQRSMFDNIRLIDRNRDYLER